MNFVNPIATAVIAMIERGLLPETLIRVAIRQMIGIRQWHLYQGTPAEQLARSQQFLNRAANEDALALETNKANEQHYEVPAEFFDLVLGPQKKYSCCYFRDARTSLADAEEAALEITCQRAGLENGMSILELGCGWGSLTLWMAARYPDSPITAVSNSRSQRAWILQQARQRSIDQRLNVVTCDINDLRLENTFDRIVSVEMFEHVRNHRKLLENTATWLAENGQMFVHIFCHKQFAYPFETQGAANWMGQHFFSGGMMPSRDLFERYDEHLVVDQQWSWPGQHYQLTANAWAANLDRNRKAILQLFRTTYGPGEELKWLMRWKVFFLASAELFGYSEGGEWVVGHYLLKHANQNQFALSHRETRSQEKGV